VGDLLTRATTYLISLFKLKNIKSEGKAIPVHAWTGPEGSRR